MPVNIRLPRWKRLKSAPETVSSEKRACHETMPQPSCLQQPSG
jgi:hypothetical protein